MVNNGFLCGIILPPWARWPGPLERTGALLGLLGPTGGSTLTPYRRLWGALGTSSASLGRLPGVFGESLGRLGVSPGVALDASLGPWAPLGCRWAPLGRLWGLCRRLWRLWVASRVSLGSLFAVLGASWLASGSSWMPLGRVRLMNGRPSAMYSISGRPGSTNVWSPYKIGRDSWERGGQESVVPAAGGNGASPR